METAETARMSTVELRDELGRILRDPGRVSDGDSERELHAGDISFHRPHRPDLVVYATSTADVVAVLTLADRDRIPVTPFAAGSSLEGHVIPVAGGRVVRAGSRAPKTSAGYDLLGLMIGSEGTLGVITELTLRLHGIPEQAVVLRLSFPDVESACRAATAIVAAGAGVTRAELLDGWTIAAINDHQGTDLPVGASLFVEASGSEGTVTSDLELVTQIAESEGALDVVAERDPTARTRLWAARHAAAYAVAAAAPGMLHRSTDICVPLSELAGAVSFARRELDRRGLVAGIVGHAGDGNVHLALMVDPDDPDSVRVSDELIEALVEDALARGGTCTGEHGVGIGKIGSLEREHGDLLPLMRGIKAVFDPNGIMNPGKVLTRG